MLIRDEVITTSGFLETIFGNSPVGLAKVKNMHRIWNFSKMLIGDEVITSSGFLETILGVVNAYICLTTVENKKPSCCWMADSWPHINIIDFRNRDLKWPLRTQPRSKVIGVILLIGHRWTYLCIGTPGLGATVEMICTTFTFVTWKNPLKVNRGQRSRCNFITCAMVNIFVYRHPGPRSTVEMICTTFTFVKWKNPLKVNRGQRSRCTFISWAVVNIFVYRHPGPRSNRWDDMRHFHFRDLENPLKVIRGQRG